MPQRIIDVAPELVVEHQGVCVYRCYQHNDADKPEQFNFTTDHRYTDSGDAGSFDVRELPVPSAAKLKTDEPQEFKGPGTFTRPTRAYHKAVEVWNEWYETTQPALIRQALIEAIELNNIK